MTLALELDQQRSFDRLVNQLIEVGSSLCSSEFCSDLVAPISGLSKEIHQLRTLAATSTMAIEGRPVIANDFHALREFTTLNQIDLGEPTNTIAINDEGRIYFLWYRQSVIKDLTPLATLTALKEVSLTNSSVKDLSPLSELHLLERVTLDQNRMFCSQSLTKLQSIKDLSVADAAVSDLSWISLMPHLTCINLGRNNIADIGAIVPNFQLKGLNLQENPITNVEPLRSLPNLITLNLTNTLVEDFSPLFDIPTLCHLFLDAKMIDRGNRSGQIPELVKKGVWVSPV